MAFLSDLWLAVLVAAVFVFIVSSLVHMVLQYHKSDYGRIDGEAQVLKALRERGLKPGAYVFPGCESMKDMGSPEMLAKYREGPVGHMTILPTGVPSIGKCLIQWFLFCVVIGVFVAYGAWHALPKGAPYLEVFRLTGTLALLGYSASYAVDAIWKGQRWRATAKYILDGLLYALVTAGAFGWLWPAAV